MALEKEMSLGEFLRHERESRGITIEQVASTTKVGIRTLHALEADHYAELPAKPFIRGFVTAYCRFIGLDAKEVLARFEDFLFLKSSERPSREAGHSGYAFEKKDGEQQSRTILIFAMVVFIGLGGVAMFFLKPSLRHHRNSHIDQLRTAYPTPNLTPYPKDGTAPTPVVSPISVPSPVVVVVLAPVSVPPVPTTVVTMEPVPVVTPTATPIPIVPEAAPAVSAPVPASPAQLVSPSSPDPTEQAEQKIERKGPGENPDDPLDSGLVLKGVQIKHKITFKMLNDTWVRYQVDDRPVRKFVIRQGKILILRAEKQIKFQASQPESVMMSYNGGESHPMSENDKVLIRQGDLTVFYPTSLSSKILEPFKGEKSLPKNEQLLPDKKNTESVPASESSPE